MKALRIAEIVCSVLLFGLFFRPYFQIGRVSIPGHKIGGHIDTTHRLVSMVGKRADLDLAHEVAPVLYGIPLLAAAVAVCAARGRTVAGWDLAAAALSLAVVCNLQYQLIDMKLVRLGYGALLSLLPAAMLWAAGIARCAIHYTPGWNEAPRSTEDVGPFISSRPSPL
jgi:hypothetical protein